MSRHANALWASAVLGLALTGTAVAQTSPTPNDSNDNKNDTKNKNEPATTDDSTTPATPSTPTTNPTTTSSSPDATSTDTTATASANGTTDVPGQTGTSATVGTVSGQATLTVPPPPPAPPPPTAIQQPSTYYTTVPAPTTTVIHEHDGGYIGPDTGIGLAISAGGGAGGFLTDQLRNTTSVGGDWDVRATVGTRSLISLEGSYIGSAQQISALGLSNGATLVGNGVQGDLRLNGTVGLPVVPFMYAGAAWRRYDLTNTTQNTSDVRGADDVLEIPMGVGIASHFGRAILDVRGEFRATTNEDLLPAATATGTNGSVNMNRWDAKATIGLEF